MSSKFSIQAAFRAYSTKASNVQVPLTLYGIEGRYATALYTAAVKSKQLETVESEMKKVSAVVEKDSGVRSFLENPILSREQKKAGVDHLMGKYSDLTKNFFSVLAENRRLNDTVKIVDSFNNLMAAHRGEVSAVVTTAKPMDSKMMSLLKDVLAKSSLIPTGSSVKIVSKVNPSILGGLVVEVGDKSIDMSISSRLSKLNKLLTDSI